MTRTTKATLLTWIAKQNDPFNRNGSPGPNLTLLFDPGSPFAGQFDEFLVLYRDGGNGESEEHRGGTGSADSSRLDKKPSMPKPGGLRRSRFPC